MKTIMIAVAFAFALGVSSLQADDGDPPILSGAGVLIPLLGSERQPIDDVKALSEQLAHLQGITVLIGGINQAAGMRALADAIIDIDARLKKIEQKK